MHEKLKRLSLTRYEQDADEMPLCPPGHRVNSPAKGALFSRTSDSPRILTTFVVIWVGAGAFNLLP